MTAAENLVLLLLNDLLILVVVYAVLRNKNFSEIIEAKVAEMDLSKIDWSAEARKAISETIANIASNSDLENKVLNAEMERASELGVDKRLLYAVEQGEIILQRHGIDIEIDQLLITGQRLYYDWKSRQRFA